MQNFDQRSIIGIQKNHFLRITFFVLDLEPNNSLKGIVITMQKVFYSSNKCNSFGFFSFSRYEMQCALLQSPTVLSAQTILGRSLDTINESAPGRTRHPAEAIYFMQHARLPLSLHMCRFREQILALFLIKLKRKNYRSALRRKIPGNKQILLLGRTTRFNLGFGIFWKSQLPTKF